MQRQTEIPLYMGQKGELLSFVNASFNLCQVWGMSVNTGASSLLRNIPPFIDKFMADKDGQIFCLSLHCFATIFQRD